MRRYMEDRLCACATRYIRDWLRSIHPFATLQWFASQRFCRCVLHRYAAPDGELRKRNTAGPRSITMDEGRTTATGVLFRYVVRQDMVQCPPRQQSRCSCQPRRFGRNDKANELRISGPGCNVCGEMKSSNICRDPILHHFGTKSIWDLRSNYSPRCSMSMKNR